MEVKALSNIASKWKRNASQAGDSYREGVSSPRRSWADSTANADDARREGLAAADARNAFVEGVREAGDAKWKRNSTTLGPARFRQGVSASEGEFQQGFSRYHSVLQGLTLPPRGPKGSPENIDRVRAVAEALHNERVGA